MTTLQRKILDKSLHFGVIGLGYVGLPLALEFAEAGYPATGIDIDDRKVAALQRGTSYVVDVPSDQLARLVDAARFTATTDYSVVGRLDGIAICVPTPLRKSKDPDISYVASATEQIKPYLHKDMIVILESTTYPGTTEELIRPAVEEAGLRVGKDVFVCFSPERVDPGNKQYHTRNTPKVIGGLTPECTRMGSELYSHVIDHVIPVSSARTAEMVKLLENTFRAVNIALVNELALMCERMGINIWEVIEAASSKPFGYMPFYPGPGIGGHCIPLDPMYLSWKAKTYNFFSRFIELATDINANMPYHTVDYIVEILNRQGKAVLGSNILCLGVSYKPDVSDTRESPSIDVIHLLRKRGAVVRYVDPFVPDVQDNGMQLCSEVLTDDILRWADCVVLLTNHSQFDYELVVRNAKAILDTRNALRSFRDCNIFRLGSPLPESGDWRRSDAGRDGAALARI